MKHRHIVLLLLLASPIILSIFPAYAELNITQFATVNKPIDIIWTEDGFIASHREGSSGITLISPDGKSVKPFSPSFSGTGEVHLAVSHGKGGFPNNYIYASSGNTIYQIDPSGNEVKTFAIPSEKAGIRYLTFDTVGKWGYLLYAVDSDGLLWAIDPQGKPKLVVKVADNALPGGMAVAPIDFGKFGGDLIITLEKERKVLAVSHQDPSKATILLSFKEETPRSVLPISPNSDLYLAKHNDNTIVSISSYQISPYAGGIVVITKGEAGEQGSVSVLKMQGEVIAITKLAENIVNPGFMGAAFAPAGVAKRTTVTAVTTTTTFIQTMSVTDFAVIGVMALAVVILLFVFVQTRKPQTK